MPLDVMPERLVEATRKAATLSLLTGPETAPGLGPPPVSPGSLDRG